MIQASTTSSGWQQSTAPQPWPRGSGTRCVGTIPADKWDGNLTTWQADRLFLHRALDAYFRVSGLEQKRLRPGLANQIASGPMLRSMVAMVLDKVSQLRSQEAIQAAIDLLTQVGSGIVRIAEEAATSPTLDDDENAAFALASAAGRVDAQLAQQVLAWSRHTVIREAAMEIIAAYPAAQARDLLGQIVNHEQETHLRQRACDLLGQIK